MHKKAIHIKESLLGLEDYEVALSLGHLASLYNYDMRRYEEAERLYLRSIEISKSNLHLRSIEISKSNLYLRSIEISKSNLHLLSIEISKSNL